MALNRLQEVRNFLQNLNNLRPRIGNRASNIFELFCYTRKLNEFLNRGMNPIPQRINHNIFSPHLGPGSPENGSYYLLEVPNGADFNLYLNCQFPGVSRVLHCPDIVLQNANTSKIHSIYECKHNSGLLKLEVLREFIGYLCEMNIKKHNAREDYDYNPELKPTIYTSATADAGRINMRRKYNFDVIDNL